MVEVVVGGFYKSADGEKVGPMNDYSGEFFSVNGEAGLRLWWKNGRRYSRENSHNDLIAEWVDEPAAPVAPAPEVEDGKWHGWNGGECPVHPDTVVQVKVYCGDFGGDYFAKNLDWSSYNELPLTHIVAFRVIKRYVEPKAAREFWLVGGISCHSASVAESVRICSFGRKLEIVHVREVIEPEIDQDVK